MSKALPYYKMYPADAETDENFRAMTDEELGFYWRCLNHCWINGSLPADPEERARVMRTPQEIADRLWKRVGKCFVEFAEDSIRVVNRRQEKEREEARSKSEKARLSVASRKDRRDTNVIRTLYERTTNDPIRAYESDYVSGSENSKEENSLKPEDSISGFDGWWKLWSDVKGTAYEDAAIRAWMSLCPPLDVIPCTQSYLDSLDNASRGFRPDNFLFEQAKTGYRARWPPNQKIPPRVLPKKSAFDDPYPGDHA